MKLEGIFTHLVYFLDMKKELAAFIIGIFSIISCSPNPSCLNKEGSIRADQVEPTRYIRTRVYVETIVIKTEAPELSFTNFNEFIKPQKLEPILLPIPARAPSEIINDFNISEKKLESLHIRFCIEEIVFFPAHTAPINSEVDLCNYSDGNFPPRDNSMNVYYIFSNNGKSSYVGIGNFPWSGQSTIMLLGSSSEGSLAHEIGHFLGLYHTFDRDDYVDDTPRVVIPEGINLSQFLGEKETDPCYNNIMTYYDNINESCFTPGQIKRMRYFLLKKPRNDLVMEEYEGFPLEVTISKTYLMFIEQANRNILRNPNVPVVCQDELVQILIRTGFLSPIQPGVGPTPPSN